MKNLILIFVLAAATSFTSFASTTPVKAVKVFENAAATVTIDEADAELFEVAEYNANGNFVFETTSDIDFIQIFNAEGTLEFQLPVMSDKVTIGNGLIEKGDYKLGFMVQGSTTIHFTDVSVK